MNKEELIAIHKIFNHYYKYKKNKEQANQRRKYREYYVNKKIMNRTTTQSPEQSLTQVKYNVTLEF